MKRRQTDPWNFLFIAGMWFQDLFNYDFRRTEMCIIPYATQQGEISLLRLQHRRGLAPDHRKHAQERDRRRVVQEPRQTRNLRQGQERQSRHSFEHSLVIDADDAARVRHLEHDIPLTAAEEDRAGAERTKKQPRFAPFTKNWF